MTRNTTVGGLSSRYGAGYAPLTGSERQAGHPEDTAPSKLNTEADVVIVGSGFTEEASTALFLAREHGNFAPSFSDANQTAWGCTSRNGGQGQNAAVAFIALNG